MITLILMILDLIILGARCLTAAKRAPPAVARPVRAVGVTLVPVPVLLIHVLLSPVLLNHVLLRPVLLIWGPQRLGANRINEGSNLLLSC